MISFYFHSRSSCRRKFNSLIVISISESLSQTPDDDDGVAKFSLGHDEHQEAFQYKIYVTTFLGYGANKAFEKYIDSIISIALK